MKRRLSDTFYRWMSVSSNPIICLSCLCKRDTFLSLLDTTTEAGWSNCLPHFITLNVSRKETQVSELHVIILFNCFITTCSNLYILQRNYVVARPTATMILVILTNNLVQKNPSTKRKHRSNMKLMEAILWAPFQCTHCQNECV